MRVTIAGPTLIAPMVGVTDGVGAYRAPALPPGRYTATFELAGFETLEFPNIVVNVGQTAALELVMRVAAVRAVFVVRAVAPTIDTTSPNVSTTIDLGILNNTPGGRDIWSLLQSKAAGLTTDRIDVGGSESGLQAGFVVRGTPHGQNTQALNAVNVSDPASTGFADFYYDYDTFQQVHVSTGAHPVEVGPPGVYVNMVTKTGTDLLRGRVSFYYQNDRTQSNNIDQALRDKGITRAGFDYLSDFTAQLGGPLVKDRLRFFGAYRDWRVHRFVAGFVDDAGEPVVEPTDMYSGLINATYQIDPKQRLTVFWARQAYKKPQRDASALNTPLSNWNEDDTFSIYQGLWSGVIGERMYVEGRLSYVDILFPLRIKEAARAAGNQSVFELTTNRITGANTSEQVSERSRLQANAVLSWYQPRWLGSRHEFKFGWDFADSRSRLTVTALDDVNVATFTGFPAFALRLNTPVHPRETIRSHSLFAADTLQYGRVAVTIGGRFEWTQGIVPEQSSPAGTFAAARQFPALGAIVDWKSVSPRAGVIYQLTDDRRTALKISGARYYHQMSTAVPASANPNGLGYDVVEWADPNGDSKFQPNEAGQIVGASGGLQTSIDPSLKPPFTDEFLITVERELMPDFRLSGIVSFRRERRQVGLKDVTSVWEPAVVTDPSTGADITVFNKSAESFGLERYRVINSAQLDQDFRGFEVIATKRLSHRWELLGSYSLSRAIQQQVTVSGDIFGISATPVDPNDAVNARGPIFWDRTHVLKLSGSYELPRGGVVVSANLAAQSGPVFTRTLSVVLNQGPETIFAEPRDRSGRLDTLTTLDLRGSKQFRLSEHRTFEALVEVYNLFNANTVLNANPLDGPTYGDPLTILSPRIVRVAGRFSF